MQTSETQDRLIDLGEAVELTKGDTVGAPDIGGGERLPMVGLSDDD